MSLWYTRRETSPLTLRWQSRTADSTRVSVYKAIGGTLLRSAYCLVHPAGDSPFRGNVASRQKGCRPPLGDQNPQWFGHFLSEMPEKKAPNVVRSFLFGTPGGSRTRNLRRRRATLYPIALRVRSSFVLPPEKLARQNERFKRSQKLSVNLYPSLYLFLSRLLLWEEWLL